MRPAVPGDADFLLAMLVEAGSWDPGRPALIVEDVVARPELFHYVDGWPRSGDAGVVAEDADGGPTGAAWYREFSDADPGYGFVDATVPEVAIGVVPGRRGEGIGHALLDALHALARQQGLHALSLSVETANPARRLYERVGYAVVDEQERAVTMIVRL